MMMMSTRAAGSQLDVERTPSEVRIWTTPHRRASCFTRCASTNKTNTSSSSSRSIYTTMEGVHPSSGFDFSNHVRYIPQPSLHIHIVLWSTRLTDL
jgi:hypothetical protein